jgi:hypothetical protein
VKTVPGEGVGAFSLLRERLWVALLLLLLLHLAELLELFVDLLRCLDAVGGLLLGGIGGRRCVGSAI